MPDLEFVAIVLGALAFGALFTLVVQWATAVRALTQQITQTTRSIDALVASLQPTARRVERLGELAEESEPDLRRLQHSLQRFAVSSERLSEGVARVSQWSTTLVPILVTALQAVGAQRTPESREMGPKPAPGGASGSAPPGQSTDDPRSRPEAA